MRETLRFEYQTVAHVLSGLEDIEVHLYSRRDSRGVFPTAYLHVTRAIDAHLAIDGFHDPIWVRRYLVRFGNLYREALLRYEEGQRERVPKAWLKSFDAARSVGGLVTQHLVLGINAHINHDLALALTQVGIDPDRARKREDHDEVNSILERATPGLQHVVAERHAPILHRLGRVAGRMDENLTNFSIPRARDHAWTFAVALTDARTESERQMLREALDRQAAVMARLILATPTRNPILLKVVGAAKRIDGLFRRGT